MGWPEYGKGHDIGVRGRGAARSCLSLLHREWPEALSLWDINRQSHDHATRHGGHLNSRLQIAVCLC